MDVSQSIKWEPHPYELTQHSPKANPTL
jgi:hypothetical protein